VEPDGRPVRLGGVEVIPAEPLSVAEDVTVPPLRASFLSFTDFYRASRDEVARALSLTLGNADLGTEAADEAMARAYQRWSSVAAYGNPTGWVYRVGLNWATSVLRRRSRAPQPLADRESQGIGAVAEPDVSRAIAELDVRQRAVVVCRYLLGWSVAETATALATPEGTVKSRLHRASVTLATRLAHLRPEEP
jgi:RNA polymerase sigma factor (sigma-70 family)